MPRRSPILFHAGNTHRDTHGCILIGLSAHGEEVSDSRDAIEVMRGAHRREGFRFDNNGYPHNLSLPAPRAQTPVPARSDEVSRPR